MTLSCRASYLEKHPSWHQQVLLCLHRERWNGKMIVSGIAVFLHHLDLGCKYGKDTHCRAINIIFSSGNFTASIVSNNFIVNHQPSFLGIPCVCPLCEAKHCNQKDYKFYPSWISNVMIFCLAAIYKCPSGKSKAYYPDDCLIINPCVVWPVAVMDTDVCIQQHSLSTGQIPTGICRLFKDGDREGILHHHRRGQ